MVTWPGTGTAGTRNTQVRADFQVLLMSPFLASFAFGVRIGGKPQSDEKSNAGQVINGGEAQNWFRNAQSI